MLQSCTYAPSHAKVDTTSNYLSRLMSVGGSGNAPEPIVSTTVEEEPVTSRIENFDEDKAQLTREIEKLKYQNESLKSENQELRRQLAQDSSVHSQSNEGDAKIRPPYPLLPSSNIANTSPQPNTSSHSYANGNSDKVEGKFWITSSSRKRHNSSCRYFQKSNGGPCGPDDGIPCKICGG